MNIYYTDADGNRRLSECNLSETIVPDKKMTDGTTEYCVYEIFNTTLDVCAIVTFGSKKRIAKNLRDAFWCGIKDVYKRNIPLFDVDEWYGNITFVTADKIRKRRIARILKCKDL